MSAAGSVAPIDSCLVAAIARLASRLIGRLGLSLLAAGLLASPASAHKPSDAYLHLRADDTRIAVRWDIALRDLDMLLDLDENHDGKLSWGELRRRQRDINQAALDAITLTSDAGRCAPDSIAPALARHSDGVYAVLSFAAQCPSKADRVELSYRLFSELDPSHRAIVNHNDTATVVAPDGKRVALRLAAGATAWSSLLSHIGNGVEHILAGWDHLAFLVLLVLPAVFWRKDGNWQAESDARASLRDLLLTVTAFTLAHSLTLSASVLQWLTPPSRWVEAAIALSIVVAAAMNVVGARRAHWWPVAGLFGLVHGFGFASVLNDAGLSGYGLAASLFGFNLGVEIGQIGFVALIWPLIWFGRNRRPWAQTAVPVLSGLLALAGGYWLIERIVL